VLDGYMISIEDTFIWFWWCFQIFW